MANLNSLGGCPVLMRMRFERLGRTSSVELHGLPQSRCGLCVRGVKYEKFSRRIACRYCWCMRKLFVVLRQPPFKKSSRHVSCKEGGLKQSNHRCSSTTTACDTTRKFLILHSWTHADFSVHAQTAAARSSTVNVRRLLWNFRCPYLSGLVRGVRR